MRNCSFQKPIGAGVGINADISGENLNYNNTIGGSFVNINKVEISTPDNTPRNCFYDMQTAIKIDGVDEANVSKCNIRSQQNITSLGNNGEKGIEVYNNAFAKIEIYKNAIHNIRNPIIFSGFAEGVRNLFGVLNINENNIGKEISTTYPMPNGFVENAITASAFFESNYRCADPINIKKNIISETYNGINLSGFVSKNFNVLENEIHLENDALIAPDAKH